MCNRSSPGYKILVIEACAVFRSILREVLLEKFPYGDVVEAANGAVALKAVLECNPELVFMDIGLPDASGLELTRVIKSMRPDIVVVMVTSHDTPEYRDAALEYGADAFLSKDANIACRVESIIQETVGALKNVP